MRKKLILILAITAILWICGPVSASLDSGLVGYWKFDEEPGNVVIDASMTGNDGTVYGAASVDGISGKALEFDGVGDYVDVPDAPDLNPTSAITVTAWFNVSSFKYGQYSWPSIVNKWGEGTITQPNEATSAPYGYRLGIDQVWENNPSLLFGAYLEGDGWSTMAKMVNL